MTKKFTAMFLAPALCLSLSVSAFAAGEATAVTDELAAPIGEEPATEDEPAAQAAVAHTHVYYVSDYRGVDPDNYTGAWHAYITEGHLHACSCGERYIEAESFEPQAHSFRRTTKWGEDVGDNGELITLYRYECKQCNYFTINP